MSDKTPTIDDVVKAIGILKQQVDELRDILLAPLPTNIKDGENFTPSIQIRLNALESALQFTMSQVKVTITQNSPIIGGGQHSQSMSMLDFYAQQMKQQQMLVKG